METVVKGTKEYRTPASKVVEIEVRSNYLQAISDPEGDAEGEIGGNDERG